MARVVLVLCLLAISHAVVLPTNGSESGDSSGFESGVDASGSSGIGETASGYSGFEASGLDASGFSGDESGMDISGASGWETSGGESGLDAFDATGWNTLGSGVEIPFTDIDTSAGYSGEVVESGELHRGRRQVPSNKNASTTITPTNATANATCVKAANCFADTECGEGGRCLGIFPGKCNCSPCINLLKCSDDNACGGLRGACDIGTGFCKCFDAYKEHGFPLFIDALRGLCNVKECNASSDTCFGLPCHAGNCVCPAEKSS